MTLTAPNAAYSIPTDMVSPAVAKLISEGYLLVSDKVKVAFGAGYRMAEKRRGGTAKNRRHVS